MGKFFGKNITLKMETVGYLTKHQMTICLLNYLISLLVIEILISFVFELFSDGCRFQGSWNGRQFVQKALQ